MTSKPQPGWLRFEQAVAQLLSAIDSTASVTHDVSIPDRDTGEPRQRDVWVEGTVGGFPIKILVSCKKTKRKFGSPEMDAFMGELRSSGAHKGVVFSAAGFSKPALKKAAVNGISACLLFQDRPAELPTSLKLRFLTASAQFRVNVESKCIDDWSDDPLDEILGVDRANRASRVLDELIEEFKAEEVRSFKEAAEVRHLPGPWRVERTFEKAGMRHWCSS